jgi:hypothetical protein
VAAQPHAASAAASWLQYCSLAASLTDIRSVSLILFRAPRVQGLRFIGFRGFGELKRSQGLGLIRFIGLRV